MALSSRIGVKSKTSFIDFQSDSYRQLCRRYLVNTKYKNVYKQIESSEARYPIIPTEDLLATVMFRVKIINTFCRVFKMTKVTILCGVKV
jgi:hypothetical protein